MPTRNRRHTNSILPFGQRFDTPIIRTKTHEATAQHPVFVRCSRLEFYRMLAVEVAAVLADANAQDPASTLIRLRAIQDEIALLKQRNLACANQPSRSAWVDSWCPPG